MNSIDNHIRSAILKAKASSPEARNEVYLAAREAIKKLPSEKSEVAMNELFETVKTIEAEFVKQEMSTYPPNSGSSDQHLPKTDALKKLPWIMITAILILLVIMVSSGYLLFSQFQNRDLL